MTTLYATVYKIGVSAHCEAKITVSRSKSRRKPFCGRCKAHRRLARSTPDHRCPLQLERKRAYLFTPSETGLSSLVAGFLTTFGIAAREKRVGWRRKYSHMLGGYVMAPNLFVGDSDRSRAERNEFFRRNHHHRKAKKIFIVSLRLSALYWGAHVKWCSIGEGRKC